MVKDLDGKYGLILGGSSGLGFASAVKLASHGMRVIIVYRASRMQKDIIQKRFDQLENPKDHLFINADATNSAKLVDLVSEIKKHLSGNKLHLLLHSISKGNLKPMTGEIPLSTGDFEQTIYSMGISLYSWSQALIQENLMANPSRILSFTSEGNIKPMKGYAAVSAAKATLEAITRNMALEFAAQGITTNCIQAGVTDTASLRMIPGSAEIKEHSLLRNPFSKLTQPEDVANVVYLLSKNEASWINGTIIKVDGGESVS